MAGGLFGQAFQFFQLLPCVPIIWGEPQRFFELRDRLVMPAQCGQCLTEIEMGFRKIRLVLQRFAQMRHSFVQPPLFHVD